MNQLYRGCKGVYFYSKNNVEDPILYYKDKEFNYWDIENFMWDEFVCMFPNLKNKFESYKTEEKFNKFIRKNLINYLNEIISMEE